MKTHKKPTIFDADFARGISPRAMTAYLLVFAAMGLSILSFVEPGEGLLTNLVRFLGWYCTTLGVPATLWAAADLSTMEQDLMDGLD